MLLDLDAKLDAIEKYLKRSGYSAATEEIRPVNELRMRARWFLGQALAKVERGTGPGRGKKVSQSGTSFRDYLESLNLNKNRAQDLALRTHDITSAIGIVGSIGGKMKKINKK